MTGADVVPATLVVEGVTVELLFGITVFVDVVLILPLGHKLQGDGRADDFHSRGTGDRAEELGIEAGDQVEW